jgi:PAS domain S-box-containing protein
MKQAGTPSRQLEWLLRTIGASTVVLGAVVLAGWYTANLDLIQPNRGSSPMMPLTAISFLCLGSALLAFALSRKLVSICLAASAGTLQIFTFVGYTAGFSLDFHRILHIPAQLARPQLPAPNTAVAFVCLSVAVIFMATAKPFRGRILVLALVGSSGLAIAFTSLVGYLVGVRTFEWGLPMALHTSIGLFLIGSGVFAFSWKDQQAGEMPLPNWLYLSATAIAVVFTVSLWQALATNSREQINRAIGWDLEEVRIGINTRMELRTAVLDRAAKRWAAIGELTEEQWRVESGNLLADPLDYRIVEWVDPGLRIRWLAPAEGNERLRGTDLSSDSRPRAAFEAARQQRRALVTRTVDLLTGGRGILIYAPVFQGDLCKGFVVGAFPVETLLPNLVPPTMVPGEEIAVFDGEERIYLRSPTDWSQMSKWAHQIPVDVQGVEWTVQMWPSAAKLAELRSRLPETVLATGLLLAGLLGTALYLAQKAAIRERASEALRKAMQEETAQRQQAEEELNQFFALSLEMMSVVSLDGYFKRLNPAFERTLGFSCAELQQEPFLNFVLPEDRERTVAAMEQLTAGQALASFENRYRTRDGTIRWMQWACAPVPDREVIFASARDVTETKVAHQALQRAHDELEDRVRERTAALQKANEALVASEAQVMKLNGELEQRIAELTTANQELEAFTYSVSHDLRAPLRHVDGFSKILLEDFGNQLPGDAKPLLDRVREGSQRMGRMIDELLQLSRMARREPEKRLTGLRLLVDEVIADLSGETTHREVEWRIGELPFADCDPTLTRQIFVNLLSNALKFTRPRQRAMIQVGQMERQGEKVLFVRDNGVGFSMKYADKLFGPFQRLHRQEDFEGTGVGLATVQRIIHKHGGRIWAEAALDQGATFYFTLSAPGSDEGKSSTVVEA